MGAIGVGAEAEPSPRERYGADSIWYVRKLECLRHGHAFLKHLDGLHRILARGIISVLIL